MPTNAQIIDYFNRCASFDWFYDFSDDGRVYRAGRDGEASLEGAAQAFPLFAEIKAAWARYMFSGTEWGLPKARKPRLSDYL